ncbi:TonB-dependent receptor [Flavisolibacter sp. BT320]|nr:TonB-dependent receptor [Flavisolibacter longurius]
MRKLRIFLLVGLLCSFQLLLAQSRQVTGRVLDENGVPVSGASISVKGGNTSTLSGVDGGFSINAPANATLVVSFIGYNPAEVAASASPLTVRLSQGDGRLSEVVVVGYGQTAKRELTSSVTRVKGSEVANVPVPNFNQALQGRAAGVFVESNNGKVGEGVKVRIRGQGSINASNSPLYVVDGNPINTGSLSGNALADLNFNDVESFEVLKDAAATAIYGSRGANGVVLITTKKGRSGQPRFIVGMQYGSNKPTNKRGFLNAAEYLELYREAAINTAVYHYNRAGNWRGYASEQAAINDMITYVEGRFTRYSGHSDWSKVETNTNWEDLAFQDANVGSVDVSASGGNERTRYYVSGSYNSQDGILFGNNFDRISGRINLDQQLSNRFKMGLNLSVARTNAQRVAEDNEFFTPMQIVALAPITPVRDQQGVLYNTPTTTYYNPLNELESSEYKSYSYRNIGAVFGQFDFNRSLFLRTEFGIDLNNQNDEEFYGSTSVLGRSTNGFGRSTWLRNVRYTTNTYANFKKTFSDVHSIDATLGFAYEKGSTRTSSVQGEQFPSDDLRTLATAGKITGGSSSLAESAIESYFARINYAFRGKYLLGASGRYDGSSVFGIDKRYGFFPSVSAGWVISEEDFLKGGNTLSFLKLRASYGQLGNSLGFGNYAAQPAFVAGRYSGISVLVPGRLGNANLTWETSNQFDAGIEFGFFRNRLTAEIDFYDKRSAQNNRGFIFNLPIPFTSGYGSYITNLGEIQNTGIEFSLNSTNIAGRDFRWSTSFNFAYNKNKVLKIDGDKDTLSFNDGRYMNALIVGQPIGVHYGPRYAGVDPQNGDPLYYEQDGKTTTNDYNAAGAFVVGDPNAKYFGGLTNTFSYKGIELSVLLQGVFDYDIVNGAGGFMSSAADWFDNQTRDQMKRWQKPNDVTNVPQARLNRFGDFASPGISTQYMEDGSYVRLKNITLAYNLPNSVLSKLRLSSARIYFTGVNLATFTNYTGWDPEVNTDYRAGNINQGGDFYAAPQIKSIVFGLNIGF